MVSSRVTNERYSQLKIFDILKCVLGLLVTALVLISLRECCCYLKTAHNEAESQLVRVERAAQGRARQPDLRTGEREVIQRDHRATQSNINMWRGAEPVLSVLVHCTGLPKWFGRMRSMIK